MPTPRELRCYAYVEQPYGAVRDVLAKDAGAFFQRATAEAASRAESLVTKLKATIAGHHVDRDVVVDVTNVDTTHKPPGAESMPAMLLSFRWQAKVRASLFPSMRAELTVYPLSPDETELDLHGWYTPPGGVLGNAADALIGHRIARAVVLRFLEDVVERLKIEAAEPASAT